MRRVRWRTLAAKSAFWLVAAQASQTLGCGCGSPQERQGPPTYLSGQPSASAPAASASQSIAPPTKSEDPRDMVRVLEQPELAAVRAAIEAKDSARAAQALRAAVAEHQPKGVRRARWFFLLGSILADAGDKANGAAAYAEAAAEKTWVLNSYATVMFFRLKERLRPFGVTTVLARATGRVLELLEKAKLDDLFRICATSEEAYDALTGKGGA